MSLSKLNFNRLWNRHSITIVAATALILIATDTRPDDTSTRVAMVVGVLGLFATLDLSINRTWRALDIHSTTWHLQTIVGVFLSISTASALWAGDPIRTLNVTIMAWGLLLSWSLVKFWASRQELSRVKALLYAICKTVFIFALLLALEFSTNQFIHQFLVNSLGMSMSIPNFYIAGENHIQVSPQFLSQHVGTLSYLFWPIIMGMTLTFQKAKRLIIALFVGLAFFSIATSINQTAMLAIVVSIAVFLAANVLPRATTTLVAVLTVLATMAIVPLTYVSHDMLQLWQNPYIPPSGQGRIHIWNQVAHAIARSTPWEIIRGHGVVHLQALLYSGKGFIWEHAHAHNVFLQTWYEVGVIGAFVLLLGGLVLLRDFSKLPSCAMNCALSGFVVVVMSLVTTAWELWVPWHLGLIGVVAVVSTLLNQILIQGKAKPVPA